MLQYMYHVLQCIRNGEKIKTQRTSKWQSIDSQSLDSANVRETKWSYVHETVTGHGFCLVSFHFLVVMYARYKNGIDGKLLYCEYVYSKFTWHIFCSTFSSEVIYL